MIEVHMERVLFGIADNLGVRRVRRAPRWASWKRVGLPAGPIQEIWCRGSDGPEAGWQQRHYGRPHGWCLQSVPCLGEFARSSSTTIGREQLCKDRRGRRVASDRPGRAAGTIVEGWPLTAPVAAPDRWRTTGEGASVMSNCSGLQSGLRCVARWASGCFWELGAAHSETGPQPPGEWRGLDGRHNRTPYRPDHSAGSDGADAGASPHAFSRANRPAGPAASPT